MTAIKWRFATLGLALAALLVSALAATGSPAMAAASSCANTGPVFFGLHGMYEAVHHRPAKFPGDPGLRLRAESFSGAVLNDPVPYPTATASLPDLINLVSFVKTGENNLQSYLAAWTKGCTTAQDKVALVGYSMGAWVINKWLKDHSSELSMIKAVALYGDPCWDRRRRPGAGPAARPQLRGGARVQPAQGLPVSHDCPHSPDGELLPERRPGMRGRLQQQFGDGGRHGVHMPWESELPAQLVPGRPAGRGIPQARGRVRGPAACRLTWPDEPRANVA